MRKGILLLFIGLFMSVNVQAQNVQQITLQEAIDIALENNYQLEQARNNLDLSENFLLGEKLDYAPSVNASANGYSSTGNQFVPGTDRFVSQNVKGFSGNLSASIPIFQGFENINSLRSAQFDKKSQAENVMWVRESIIFQTASTYLQLLLNKALLEIARENLQTSRQQLKQVEVQVEVGARPTVDLYNQQATVANNELEVTNRENSLQMSRLQLISIMQVDPRKEYEFVTPEISDEEIEIQRYELPTLVNTALENRSDLERERYTIEALEYQLKATRGSLYPSLSFSASIGSRYNNQSALSFNDQFFDFSVNKSLGLSLNIPIFNGLDRRINVQSQKINYKNARLSLENTRLEVIQEVSQAYSDYQSIIKQIQAAEKALQAAERSYVTQKQRYEIGAGTLIELSEANARYVQAQADYTSARYNYIFQQKILEYYIGKLSEDVQLR